MISSRKSTKPESEVIIDTDEEEDQHFIPSTDDEAFEYYSENWVMQGIQSWGDVVTHKLVDELTDSMIQSNESKGIV